MEDAHRQRAKLTFALSHLTMENATNNSLSSSPNGIFFSQNLFNPLSGAGRCEGEQDGGCAILIERNVLPLVLLNYRFAYRWLAGAKTIRHSFDLHVRRPGHMCYLTRLDERAH